MALFPLIIVAIELAILLCFLGIVIYLAAKRLSTYRKDKYKDIEY